MLYWSLMSDVDYGLVGLGDRLFMIEPHHSLGRAARLLRPDPKTYRAREFWTDKRNRATHDCVTRGEVRARCPRGGFDEVRIRGFAIRGSWIPGARPMVADPLPRFGPENALGSVRGRCRFAALAAVEAHPP